MRCNLEWLRQWVAIAPEDARALGERLTLAGLEVDSVSAAAPALPKVVAARVESVAAHPDAARLQLCRVDAGAGRRRRVVCGAPNVREGLCAPLALEGARIGDRAVSKTVIRGVESEGMLCSGAELGLGDHSDGLLDLGAIEPGAELGEHLGAGDLIYDLELTPNRADCFSVIGIAREIAVLQGGALPPPETPAVAAAHENRCEVAVDAADACPRYLSRVVTGLNPAAAAPLWMRERLRRCGMRSVHPVVDVLNYVMLETGQPMHAFDRRRLSGEVRVRFANDAESLLPIGADSADDGAALALNRETLVIADESGPVAVAGVIGGAHSAVGADTRDIVIECAFFAPQAIAGRARALGLHTESSHRFERGVDPHLQQRALARATQLLLEIAGGAPGPVHEVESAPHLPQFGAIALRAAAVEKRLGVAVAGDFIAKTLHNLGCRVETAEDGWRCLPPSWRFDLHIEEDLIEEIARFHGYDNIPEQWRPGGAPFAAAADNGAARLRARNRRLDERLVEAGYYEVVTYSFIADDPAGRFNGATAPRLQNPISSELSVMRTSLWPGLLQVLARNLHRRRERVRIFERGPAFFVRDGRPGQAQMLAGLAYGALHPEQWGDDGAVRRRGGDDGGGASREGRGVCGFYDVKGDIERLLRGAGDLVFEACEHPALHPGRAAAVLLDGARVGCLGQLSPAAERQLELPAAMPVLLFELETGRIAAPAPVACKPVSPYPSVRRDIAVVFPAAVTAAAVLRCINGLKLDCLAETVIFDVFEGGDIQSGCRSMALGLIFQDLSGTLTGGASDAWVEAVVAALRRDLDGQLRMTSAAAPDG